MSRNAIAWLALAALLPLGLLAWGAVMLAETYWSENHQLEDLATALVPEDGTVVDTSSNECNLSGWPGIFSFRDTCYEVRVNTGTGAIADRTSRLRELAGAQGWEFVGGSSPGNLDLRRPGYDAVIRLREAADIQTCVASASEPPFCYDSIMIIEAR